jgi:hypothetical protein
MCHKKQRVVIQGREGITITSLKNNIPAQWYVELIVTFPGLIALLVLLGLAKAARYFNLGPQWLRRFEIEKHTQF